MAKKLVIGADHGGVGLKGNIIRQFGSSCDIEDVGAYDGDPVDYPLYGFEAAKKVSEGEVPSGIVICKSGIGMSIIANKLSGVRAALCHSVQDAVSSRQHNDANVLVLAAAVTTEEEALQIVDAWMKTEFLGGRHARRVDMIKEYERQLFK
jgi:RpiB/LacA/LacB family sugar-phosphate isomerase